MRHRDIMEMADSGAMTGITTGIITIIIMITVCLIIIRIITIREERYMLKEDLERTERLLQDRTTASEVM